MTLPMIQERGGAASGLVQGLGLGLQQAIPSIQEMIMKRQKDKQIEKILSSFSGTSEEGEAKGPKWQHLLALHQAGAGDVAQTLAPFVAAQQKSEIKQEQEKKEQASTREALAPISKQLESMIGALGSQPGNLEMSEELDALGFWYTDKIYTHFNKGVINKEKFKNMKNDLAPNSKLTPRENRARLKSLNTIMGLSPDTSAKNFDKALDHEIKKVKKVSGGKDISENGSGGQITEDVAMKILQEAGGDPEEATKIAKQRGYVF